MKDVSDVFDHYRNSARAIWNTAFWPDADLRNWDSVDSFDEIQRILFREHEALIDRQNAAVHIVDR